MVGGDSDIIGISLYLHGWVSGETERWPNVHFLVTRHFIANTNERAYARVYHSTVHSEVQGSL